MRFLLDVNVLIALTFSSHTLHDAAHSWFGQDAERLWATCPLTQAGFLRVASRQLGGSRDSVQRALAALERDCRSENHQFWANNIDLRLLDGVQRARLIGPSQVTDMQLLLLANGNDGQLATFDTGMRELVRGTRYEKALLVL